MSNLPLIPFSATIHVRDRCLCLHAQRAARTLARRFDRVLKPFSLTNGQFSLMMSLNRPKPASLGSVATLLGMDRTTLTAALKVLERKGWITIAKGAEDRREKFLVLTAEGEGRLAAALPIWRATHEAIEGEMPQGEADRLRHGLNALGALD
ncbi:MAG: putative transcriptional regulator protein MarR family [Rhizobium sp.]|nr:putative transcriptional regulator protein MarR family [Rhizobium sp.]